MRTIYNITKKIDKEMDCAEAYIDDAVIFQADDPGLAELYFILATEEIDHAGRLHGKAVDVIEKTKAKGVEVPAGMMDQWKKEHAEYVDRMAKIKFKLSEAKK